MVRLKLGFTIAATAFSMSVAQAALTPSKLAAPVDHVEVVCKTIIRNTNNKTIGQKVMREDLTGVVARGLHSTTPPSTQKAFQSRRTQAYIPYYEDKAIIP